MCRACSTDRGERAASRAAAAGAPRPGLPARAGILLIALYRLTLSPLVGRECRYLPTCSHYAEEAITRHGLWAGGFMTLARLSRCHPFGASGYDPVPEAPPAAARWWRPWRYGRWTGAHIDPATRLDR